MILLELLCIMCFLISRTDGSTIKSLCVCEHRNYERSAIVLKMKFTSFDTLSQNKMASIFLRTSSKHYIEKPFTVIFRGTFLKRKYWFTQWHYLSKWWHILVTLVHIIRLHYVKILGLYSLCGWTSYPKMSRCHEAARFGFKLFQSLCNLTFIWAAPLPRCLSNFRAIRS